MGKISVVMSTYNERIEFLSLALESIINQSYKNLEFIIILDNPQNSEIKNCVYKHSLLDNRIRVIENDKNIGLTASLNKGFKVATGDFYARMDADDISDPSRLEMELAYLLENNLDLTGCMTRRIDENGVVVNNLTNISYPTDFLEKKLLFDNCIAHPTWLFKRKLFDRLNGYREIKTAEDYDFLLRAIKSGFKLGICNSCLFSYRISLAGISRSNSLRQFLTSDFLQKNLYKIDDINQEYIDCEILSKIDKERNDKFEEGVKLLNKAIEQFKHTNPLAIISLIRAIFHSPYIMLKVYKIFKIHTI